MKSLILEKRRLTIWQTAEAQHESTIIGISNVWRKKLDFSECEQVALDITLKRLCSGGQPIVLRCLY